MPMPMHVGPVESFSGCRIAEDGAVDMLSAEAPFPRDAPPRPPTTALAGPPVQFAPPGLPAPTPTTMQATGPAAATSTWWSNPDEERTIDIDGHSFDFEPDSVVGERVTGEVDGPFKVNGTYAIFQNHAAGNGRPDNFAMAIKIKGSAPFYGDVHMDLALVISEGSQGARATVTYHNKLADGAPGPVRTTVPVTRTAKGFQFAFDVPRSDPAEPPKHIVVKW